MIQHQLPIIAELEEEFELEYWTGEITMSDEEGGFWQKTLKVWLGTDTYAGTGTKTIPRDWRGFEYLKFEIFSETDTLKLTLRIHDKAHIDQYNDRFNTRLEISGWNSFPSP